MSIKSASAADAAHKFLQVATKAELRAFELGLERAAEYLADHALHEEDAACRQLCFDMAQEIAALKPPSDDHNI
jgi:hypothetical protein